MQQLDLFSSFEMEPAPKKEEHAVNIVAEPQTAAIPEMKPEEIMARKEKTADELAIRADENMGERFVFVDDKIRVKIKPKNTAAEEPKQPAVEEPKQLAAVNTPGKRGRKSYREIDSEVDFIEVPEDEVLNQKLYYSITEVAKWFRVNASLLRYWENEFDILKPRKNRKGDRLFRPEDIRNLKMIYYLLRNRKFSIEGAKKYLRNNHKQVDNNLHIIESLTKFRSFLLELKANLGS